MQASSDPTIKQTGKPAGFISLLYQSRESPECAGAILSSWPISSLKLDVPIVSFLVGPLTITWFMTADDAIAALWRHFDTIGLSVQRV